MGRDVGDPEALRDLGMVPQELAVYGDLTARENLEVFGKLHGLHRRDLRSRVDWALEWTGLTERQRDLVGTFSGGMKRRINIACGVLHAPGLLLLDEPTVGVDPQSRQRIFDMLDQLHRLGTTIVLTTHHLDEAQSRCDRIVVLDLGTVIAQGSLDQLIEDTVGWSKRLSLRPKKGDLPPDDYELAQFGFHWQEASGCWTTTLRDVVQDLPKLLRQLSQKGIEPDGVQVHEPNLHDVFLHLTGRGLRE
jgi:ABC-2 type transport system ATP-binding protein